MAQIDIVEMRKKCDEHVAACEDHNAAEAKRLAEGETVAAAKERFAQAVEDETAVEQRLQETGDALKAKTDVSVETAKDNELPEPPEQPPIPEPTAARR